MRTMSFGCRSGTALHHALFRTAVAAVVCALCLLAGTASKAQDSEGGQGRLRVAPSGARGGTIVMSWVGPILAPMSSEVRAALERHKDANTRFVLRLSSGGGSVAEGERVIELLRQIKQTHELETVVAHGDRCGSMCVFIYLQGQKRIGALTSSWLFHEVSRKDRETGKIIALDRARWEQLVDKYFRPAGVSDTWIAQMKEHTVKSDYWQTGADLVQANSGIIHAALGNTMARNVAPGSRPGATPQPQPQPQPEVQPHPQPQEARAVPRQAADPSTCRVYLPSIDAVLKVPCS
jgi:ATP-dependent protease ClpP protease subunit